MILPTGILKCSRRNTTSFNYLVPILVAVALGPFTGAQHPRTRNVLFAVSLELQTPKAQIRIPPS